MAAKTAKTSLDQLQQGDVTLQRVKKLPAGAVPEDKAPSPVIMEGEGHHVHTLASLEGVRFFNANNKRYMEVTTPVALKHEGVNGGAGEHASVSVEPGIWEIGQVFEFDHYQNLSRAVVD